MTVEEVKEELRRGNRVLLMVRHGERPHIQAGDPTFGMTLPLTDAGEKMGEEYGAMFREFADEAQLMASPLLRTRLTARAIARGLGISQEGIPEDNRLGNDSPYFADHIEVWRLFRETGKFYDNIFEYFAKGEMRGFRPIFSATDALESFVVAKFTKRLGIFTTHDLYNGAFLVARGVEKAFTREAWIRYLDGAAIIIEPDGKRRYALVRSGFPGGI